MLCAYSHWNVSISLMRRASELASCWHKQNCHKAGNWRYFETSAIFVQKKVAIILLLDQITTDNIKVYHYKDKIVKKSYKETLGTLELNPGRLGTRSPLFFLLSFIKITTYDCATWTLASGQPIVTADVLICKGLCSLKISTIHKNLEFLSLKRFEKNRKQSKSWNLYYLGTTSGDKKK